MLPCMAKRRTTITVTREKVEEARRLSGAPSTSATIEIALDRLIRAERLRKDIVAYKMTPPDDAELAVAAATPPWDDLADETDWAALYAED
jgi:hypothetical protein